MDNVEELFRRLNLNEVAEQSKKLIEQLQDDIPGDFAKIQRELNKCLQDDKSGGIAETRKELLQQLHKNITKDERSKLKYLTIKEIKGLEPFPKSKFSNEEIDSDYESDYESDSESDIESDPQPKAGGGGDRKPTGGESFGGPLDRQRPAKKGYVYFAAEESGLCFRVGMTRSPRSCRSNLQQGNPELLRMLVKVVNDKRAAKRHLRRVMIVMYRGRAAHQDPLRTVHGRRWFVADQEHGGLAGAQWLFMQIAALYPPIQ